MLTLSAIAPETATPRRRFPSAADLLSEIQSCQPFHADPSRVSLVVVFSSVELHFSSVRAPSRAPKFRAGDRNPLAELPRSPPMVASSCSRASSSTLVQRLEPRVSARKHRSPFLLADESPV
ncbi:uncharacterized protein M6B38_265150 [Iris pallida]|uniref:Uncharacterized protein n=1 Tax=Iris pallida TaxID=29817 RepID=A0AAX6IB20_IRIPA|nr:uncharacterized protein M6B38_265150 [Iris pallida]